MKISHYGIFFLFALIGLVMVSPVQAYEYSRIERTATVELGKIREEDDPGSGTDEGFWTGWVNPDEGLVRVNVTVTEITNPDPLQLSLFIESQGELMSRSYLYPVERSMNPDGHQLAAGDHFEFENDTTWNPSDASFVAFKIRVDSITNAEITGTITSEVWFSLSGYEKIEETSSGISGFEWAMSLLALILIPRVWNSQYNIYDRGRGREI